jgi:hypothetical protein
MNESYDDTLSSLIEDVLRLNEDFGAAHWITKSGDLHKVDAGSTHGQHLHKNPKLRQSMGISDEETHEEGTPISQDEMQSKAIKQGHLKVRQAPGVLALTGQKTSGHIASVQKHFKDTPGIHAIQWSEKDTDRADTVKSSHFFSNVHHPEDLAPKRSHSLVGQFHEAATLYGGPKAWILKSGEHLPVDSSSHHGDSVSKDPAKFGVDKSTVSDHPFDNVKYAVNAGHVRIGVSVDDQKTPHTLHVHGSPTSKNISNVKTHYPPEKFKHVEWEDENKYWVKHEGKNQHTKMSSADFAAASEPHHIFPQKSTSVTGQFHERIEPLPVEDCDPEELKMGSKVEMEHTDNKDEASEIARQHLREDPKYYSKGKSKGMFPELDESAYDQLLDEVKSGSGMGGYYHKGWLQDGKMYPIGDGHKTEHSDAYNMHPEVKAKAHKTLGDVHHKDGALHMIDRGHAARAWADHRYTGFEGHLTPDHLKGAQEYHKKHGVANKVAWEFWSDKEDRPSMLNFSSSEFMSAKHPNDLTKPKGASLAAQFHEAQEKHAPLAVVHKGKTYYGKEDQDFHTHIIDDQLPHLSKPSAGLDHSDDLASQGHIARIRKNSIGTTEIYGHPTVDHLRGAQEYERKYGQLHNTVKWFHNGATHSTSGSEFSMMLHPDELFKKKGTSVTAQFHEAKPQVDDQNAYNGLLGGLLSESFAAIYMWNYDYRNASAEGDHGVDLTHDNKDDKEKAVTHRNEPSTAVDGPKVSGMCGSTHQVSNKDDGPVHETVDTAHKYWFTPTKAHKFPNTHHHWDEVAQNDELANHVGVQLNHRKAHMNRTGGRPHNISHAMAFDDQVNDAMQAGRMVRGGVDGTEGYLGGNLNKDTLKRSQETFKKHNVEKVVIEDDDGFKEMPSSHFYSAQDTPDLNKHRGTSTAAQFHEVTEPKKES